MNIPWVEKYRPVEFDNIILDSFNKRILENILKKKIFSKYDISWTSRNW